MADINIHKNIGYRKLNRQILEDIISYLKLCLDDKLVLSFTLDDYDCDVKFEELDELYKFIDEHKCYKPKNLRVFMYGENSKSSVSFSFGDTSTTVSITGNDKISMIEEIKSITKFFPRAGLINPLVFILTCYILTIIGGWMLPTIYSSLVTCIGFILYSLYIFKPKILHKKFNFYPFNAINLK